MTRGELGSVRQLAARRRMTAVEGASTPAGQISHFASGCTTSTSCGGAPGEIDRVHAKPGLPGIVAGNPESLVATIRFRSGAVGVLELSWALPERTGTAWNTYFACIGSEQSAYVELRGADPAAAFSASTLLPELTYMYEVDGLPGGVLRLQDELFVRELREPGSWPGPSLPDARCAVEAALALRASATTGSVAELPLSTPAATSGR